MSAAPVCRTKAPHWMSPWAYNASLTPLQTKEAFHTPREHMDDQASPHTGLLSVWVWYLLGPTAAWALQASREVGPTLGRCDKPHMVDAVMEDGKLVDVVIKESTQVRCGGTMPPTGRGMLQGVTAQSSIAAPLLGTCLPQPTPSLSAL